MLRQEDFGPVQYSHLTRTIAGRRVISTGLYRIDDLLIDTGPVHSRPQVQQALAGATVTQIVLTHHHEDHVGNAATLGAKYGCTPRIHALGIPLVARTPQLPTYRRLVWGTPAPVTAEPLGEWLETERYRFRIVHTPGHAVDHVALHEPSQDWLFSGDLYLGDRIPRGFRSDDLSQLIASLRTLLAIPDCMLFCNHSGYHAGHQHRLGRKLDFLLGIQQKAIVHFEEGRSIGEIARALGLSDNFYRFLSGGEWSGRNLVRGLLRDAGKID